jgi:hypothetical protein
VSLAAVSDASAFIASKIDHRLPSRYAQAVEGARDRGLVPVRPAGGS